MTGSSGSAVCAGTDDGPPVRPPRPRFFATATLALPMVLAMTATPPAGGADDAGRRLEATVERIVGGFLARYRIPGCSVALGDAARIRLARGYGLAAPGRPASPASIYRIGSLTKQFTAALTLLSMREGAIAGPRLAIDTPLSDFFPRRFATSPITIRDLLTHTSGLASYTDGPAYRHHSDEPISTARMLDRIARARLRTRPGRRGNYSNSNYYLLARILEARHRIPFGDLARRRLFRPLGMAATATISNRPLSDDEALGAGRHGFGSRKTHPSWVLGAGDLQSSAADLARWLQALLSGEVLTRPEREILFRAGPLNREPAVPGERFAMGWMDISAPGRRAFYHQGFVNGFSAIDYLEPAAAGTTGRFVVALCNKSLVPAMPLLMRRLAEAM